MHKMKADTWISAARACAPAQCAAAFVSVMAKPRIRPPGDNPPLTQTSSN
ncbi:MAG: hypothetical protein WBQ60_05180 [Asticcacaulis sp.]